MPDRGDTLAEEIQSLIRVLQDGDSTARMSAARSLADLGSLALRDLAAALRAGDPRLRMWAAYTLGLIGDPLALQPLIRAAEDEDPGVRRWALAACERIASGRCRCKFCR
ncbi:MAG: HEAT repeat domain-containing protein [Methanomicrobiaceae archaeon]|nr:HEAT repeat domain-containing protein [Methanomicrobiaceae archaeon]